MMFLRLKLAVLTKARRFHLRNQVNHATQKGTTNAEGAPGN